MNEILEDLKIPALKIASVWAVIGITSWASAASFMAFIYTGWMLAEKIWSHLIRPCLVSRGCLQRKLDDE